MNTEVVFLGDDFTGASDSLATYARSGWRTRMLLQDHTAGKFGDLEALGIPTDLRSLSPEKARADILRRWPLIEAANPRALHVKVCSTFDSGPEIGSIGAIATTLIPLFKPDVVAVIGGQPSLGRYCVFGHLFAKGPEGEVHRIDRHPIMSRHPVTPMAESDLRRHLFLQGIEKIALVSYSDLGCDELVDAALRSGPVLLDVASQEDQRKISMALRRVGGRQLLIGASSVAEILSEGAVRPEVSDTVEQPVSGNILLFAGSRSVTTQKQLAASTRFQTYVLSKATLSKGGAVGDVSALVEKGRPVLVHLDAQEDYGLSPDALAAASSAFVSQLLDQVDVGYLGLAGGDTSSRISAQLGFDTLNFEAGFGAGVCICSATHPDPQRDRMRLMLKGGQMGAVDLFDQFAAWSEAAFNV